MIFFFESIFNKKFTNKQFYRDNKVNFYLMQNCILKMEENCLEIFYNDRYLKTSDIQNVHFDCKTKLKVITDENFVKEVKEKHPYNKFGHFVLTSILKEKCGLETEIDYFEILQY